MERGARGEGWGMARKRGGEGGLNHGFSGCARMGTDGWAVESGDGW